MQFDDLIFIKNTLKNKIIRKCSKYKNMRSKGKYEKQKF